MFNPMPYQGYQPANTNKAPPPYNQPAEYAQFDSHGGGGYRKGAGEDSLPAMPSWDAAKSGRVEHDGTHPGEDMEMGELEPRKVPGTTGTPTAESPVPGYTEADGHAVVSTRLPAGYTGPDFGVGHDQNTPHGGGQGQQQHQPYTGPDFTSQPTGYAAYAPSESTRYEPSRVNEPCSPQEMGTTTTYSNIQPPPSPAAQQQSFQHAPSILQAGQRPAAQSHGQTMWKDV